MLEVLKCGPKNPLLVALWSFNNGITPAPGQAPDPLSQRAKVDFLGVGAMGRGVSMAPWSWRTPSRPAAACTCTCVGSAHEHAAFPVSLEESNRSIASTCMGDAASFSASAHCPRGFATAGLTSMLWPRRINGRGPHRSWALHARSIPRPSTFRTSEGKKIIQSIGGFPWAVASARMLTAHAMTKLESKPEKRLPVEKKAFGASLSLL